MAYEFSQTDELKMLRDSVRKFAEAEIGPKAHELEHNEQFSPELTRKMGEMGLFGMFVDPKYGGQGLDYISYAVAVEEVARVDSSHAATVAAHNSLGVGPLYYYGTEEQKKTYLPKLCTGEHLWAFGLTEPEAGSDAQASKTTATWDESTNEWVINGSKLWITNSGSELTLGITVQAVTGKTADGKNELTCFLVDADAPGVTRKKMTGKMMWRASDTGELYFDNVRVVDSARLGDRGQGFKIMMDTLDHGRLSIAAMGLGLSKGAYHLTARYAAERRTFGKAIREHQAVAFKLADMATRIEAAENMLYKACWLKNTKQSFQKLSAMAKLYCSEVAEFCAREGQQTHGGYGLMKEYPIERHYRDAALLRVGEGTSEIQRLVISRYLARETDG